MWLTYVRWYCMVALSPDIREFFEAPIVSSSWKTVKNLVRFGLMWGLYDLVGSLGLGWLSYS